MVDGTQAAGVGVERDPGAIVARVQGRRGWEREAQHQLEEHRRVRADPVPYSRSARLLEAERRLAENLAVERAANEAYEHDRATAVTSDGRRFGARPNRYEPPAAPPGRINTTDLDSRNVKTPRSSDAHRVGERLRRRALPTTQGDSRARVRADQTQPAHGQLPATRQIGGPLGVAADHGDAQSAGMKLRG